MDTLLKKKVVILEKAKANKVLLVGGSSVLYGFDTNLMRDELGCECINCGVNVGLGFNYLIEHLEPYLASGDRVLMPLEFNQYTNPPYYVFGFGIDLFIRRNFLKRHKLYRNKLKLLLLSLKHARTSTTPEKVNRRRMAEFSSTGCYLGLDTQVYLPETLKQLKFPTKFVETSTMKQIKQFMLRCQERKITVDLLPPVFFAKNPDKRYLKKLFKYFERSDLNVTQFLLKSNEVYDSVYHANSQGQKRVTKELIEILRKKREL